MVVNKRINAYNLDIHVRMGDMSYLRVQVCLSRSINLNFEERIIIIIIMIIMIMIMIMIIMIIPGIPGIPGYTRLGYQY